MTYHLRALNVPAAACLLVFVVGALIALATFAQDLVRTSPGVLTSAPPAMIAVIAAVVLRCPVGDLAATTSRTGLMGALLASLGLWGTGLVAVMVTALRMDRGLEAVTARSCVGYAALAVLGAVISGPNLSATLVLGWLMATALISAQSHPSWWMWNMPVAAPAAGACAATAVAVAVGTVGVWWTRSSVPHLSRLN